jgi:acetyltransferase-like isoleucine patch superfamily enzyme
VLLGAAQILQGSFTEVVSIQASASAADLSCCYLPAACLCDIQFLDTLISDNSVLGAGSSLLPGSSVEPGGQVGPCSLLMKGEVVTRGARWAGLPAAPVA